MDTGYSFLHGIQVQDAFALAGVSRVWQFTHIITDGHLGPKIEYALYSSLPT